MVTSTLYSILLDNLSSGWQALEDKPDENPEVTLRALYYTASGMPVTLPRVHDLPLPDLTPEQEDVLRELVTQRAGGVPLAYLSGRQHFMGIDMLAGPGAMIPRKETEILGELALSKARALAGERGAVRALDLCTGSGNLPAALAIREPRLTAWASDISPDAVQLAQANAAFLNLDSRVSFQVSDLFAAFESPEFIGSFDLITCNPPYISTANIDRMAGEIVHYEPRAAFDGGPFGVRILMQLVREAPRFLKPASWLCFEVGLGQGASVTNLVKKTGAYALIESLTDDQGSIRALAAQVG